MNRFPPKRPADVLDYVINWAPHVGPDPLASSVVTVTGATKVSDTYDAAARTVGVVVSGGTPGVLIKILNVVTTHQARTFSRLDVIPFMEPVSIEMAKRQCRLEVDETDEDEFLGGCIIAAREAVEDITGLVLIRREVVEHHDALAKPLWLDAWPIASVDAVDATDSEGAALAIDDYRAVIAKRPGKLHPPRDSDWPTISEAEGVDVTMTAGFDEGEVPEKYVRAMLLLIHHWYTNRGAVMVGILSKEIEFTVNALCDGGRSMRIS